MLMLKLYNELAEWWPLLSPVEEYEDEAEFFKQIFLDAQLPQSPSLLELGSGGGSVAYYLKALFASVTLVDLSPGMLAVSRALNPDCEHLEGDMRNARLGRLFDAVFIHDAIAYMTTEQDLRRAMETAFVHCKPGGLALFVPDDVRENFQASTDHGGTDGEDRGIRFMTWSFDPDPNDTTCIEEFVYVMHKGNEPTVVEYEQHLNGLFARADWLRLLGEVGFQATIMNDPFERELFVARKPKAASS
jgi:SAM-dependent methyltransferase